MELIEEPVEKVILVGTDTYEALDELEELAETAGAVTVAKMVQHIDKPVTSTYLGSGKLEELANLIDATDASGIICDDELTPAQMSNLERTLKTKVMDRTMVILDIFAQHAITSEGKIQVELAQLQYRLTRLTGKGLAMSRLGGGIGTRGPGEKKLEQDRRVIRNRVAQLRRELNDVVSHREITRKKREENAIPVFAIVGYTNVGKSTLLNKLTGSDILAENKLFATLDTTTRSLEMETGEKLLLTDTVGFIRKLPHNLVDAFRSTLEEAKYADHIIHVVDASSENAEEDMKVVYETLDMLGIEGKKIITVFNKIDKLIPQDRLPGEDYEDEILAGLRDTRGYKKVRISAKTGRGIDDLLKAMSEVIKEDRKYMEKVFGYNEMSKVADIRKNGIVKKEEYRDDGIYIEAEVPAAIFNRYFEG
ncbi:MAG: GTPase HflX [Eubacterium sp.]|nr:GTPase HflX [Eubacterium sp.]